MNFCARKSDEIASLIKMRLPLKVTQCITNGILVFICSNSFSHCKVDNKKTVAISQMFNHVQLYVHCLHLLNNRLCRYTLYNIYSKNTTVLRPRQIVSEVVQP